MKTKAEGEKAEGGNIFSVCCFRFPAFRFPFSNYL